MEKRKPNNILNQSNQAELEKSNTLFQASPEEQAYHQQLEDWIISEVTADELVQDPKEARDFVFEYIEPYVGETVANEIIDKAFERILGNGKKEFVTSDIVETVNYLNNTIKEYETEKVLIQEESEETQERNEVKTDKEHHNTPQIINRKISDFFSTNYIISNMKSLLSKISKLLIESRKFKTKITLILLCGLILFHIKFASSKTYIAQCCDGFDISTTSEFQYVNYLNSIERFEYKNEFIESTKVVYFFNLTENTLYYIRLAFI